MKIKRVPAVELDFTYSRSSGAGGQNVNKVNTKVTMAWNIKKNTSFSKAHKERFTKKYSRRISEDGVIVIQSQRYRSQARNIADCIEKLNEMLEDTAKAPKYRVATRPTRSSVERRIKTKKSKSDTKKTRQKVKY